jgi:NAD(P)H-dependent FMN reductase
MDWMWLVFATVACFAMLSLMGSERQRRINDRLAAQAAADAEAAARAAEKPTNA